MRLRRRVLLLVAAVLGAAVAVLPAVAGSETAPTIEAENKPGGSYSEEHHAWKPTSVTVSPGGSVTFSNPSSIPHGVHWVSAPASPSCSAGVEATGANWSGSCAFTQTGTYTFYCTVHGKEMTGTITVGAATTTTSTTPTTTNTQPAPGGSGTTTGPTMTTGSTAPASPLAGSPSRALELKRTQRGSSVRGSLSISQAGSGARLEVDLLAARASLARAALARQVRVGRLVRSGLKPGKLSFKVPIDARARRGLQRHHRLALAVRISLTPKLGSAVRISRTVLLHD